MAIQTLDQQRAEKAMKINKSLVENRDKETARLYKKLPGLIVATGLAQALAFVDSKDKNKTIITSLLGQDGIKSILTDKYTLMNKTTEILAFVQWINRFNDASPELKS